MNDMRNKRILCKLFLLFFSVGTVTLTAHAQMDPQKYEQKAVEVRPGMEIIKVGDARILVPKGAKVRKEGDLIVIEDFGEYAGRKFEALEDRMLRVEKELQVLEEALGRLKERLAPALNKNPKEDGKPAQ
jgi:hypothetical protein